MTRAALLLPVVFLTLSIQGALGAVDVPQCNPTEVYREYCGPICAVRTCAGDPQVRCFSQCRFGCFCDNDNGYVRDASGTECIHETQCPAASTCEAGEVYSACANPCVDPFCPGVPQPRCAQQTWCFGGCVCAQGYSRISFDGGCVHPDDCPDCGSNEVFKSCGSCPDLSCGEAPSLFCTTDCKVGCFCVAGYVRDENDRCILESECPHNQCGTNEEYTECGSPCGEPSCDNPNNLGACITSCQAGCFCVSGHVRDANGDCIPQADCPPQCGINEEYKTCGSPCGSPSCDDDPNNPIACIKSCASGCFCIADHVLDANGDCIPEADCPQQCGINEEYNTCGSPCGSPSCDDDPNNPIACIESCASGCFCIADHVLDANGNCIPEADCPHLPQCHPTEIYREDCGPICGERTCAGDPQVRCLSQCRYGCFCDNDNGFVRDASGTACIHETQCPGASRCLEGEVYSCVGPCYGPFCPGVPLPPCAPYENCLYQCVCQQGYARNIEGRCVQLDDCQDCGSNEIFQSCASCPDLSCGEAPPFFCTTVCKVGCFCVTGYVRDENNRCILESECPHNQCGTNEEYNECGSPCGSPSCDDDPNNPIACIRLCASGCFCIADHVLDANGDCIPEADCPHNQCGTNEEYNECGSPCGEPSCDNPNELGGCITLCQAGCFCVSGHVRDANGDCIPQADCPPQCGINEEYKTCGSPCGSPSCDDDPNNPIACIKSCASGCFCIADHVLDANGDCIPEADCPPPCGIVNCLVSPCQFAVCESDSSATCRDNYCGGCYYDFIDTAGNVVPECSTSGKCTHHCEPSPCHSAVCATNLHATCRDNTCGGCFYDFYDKHGNHIPECSTGP